MSFSVVGSKLWNSLAIHIRTASTVSVFKSTVLTCWAKVFNFFYLFFFIFFFCESHPFYSLCFIFSVVLFINSLTCFCFPYSVQYFGLRRLF